MRVSGVVEHARGLGVHDHVCWRYDKPAEFRATAREFLADGLAAGQRVLYIGVGEPKALADELREVKGLDKALATGIARVGSVDATYAAGTVIEPAEQVHRYAALTEQAVVAGFSGLRVAADVTPLARTDEQLDALARYEHRIDHYMAARPFAAMCAYNGSELGDDVVAQVACMHAATSPETSPFRLHGTDRRGCAAAISGELDMASAESWPGALARADLQPTAGKLVFDATRLTFIDHRSLMELVRHAHGQGLQVVMRGGPPSLSRLVDLLDLAVVQMEPMS
jgi:anti-anti-sigma regulatory factor